MRHLTKCVLATAMLFSVNGVSQAGDAEAGKAKTATCVACHGAEGIGIAPNYPNLACQKEKYLVKAITDYKSGTRKEPLMAPMVAALSDADIENIAAYYATLNCK